MATDIKTKITAGTDSTYGTAKPYTLPAATASTLGGVKVGDGLSVTSDGTLSAEGWATVTLTANASTISQAKYDVIVDNWPHVLLDVGGGMYTPTAAYFNSQYTFSSDDYYKFSSNYVMAATHLIRITSDLKLDKTNSNLRTAKPTENSGYGIMRTDETSLKTSTDGNGVISVKDGGITSAKLADGAVTAGKIADGAITADKLASGVGGGIKWTTLGRFNSSNVRWSSKPIFPNIAFYIDASFSNELTGLAQYDLIDYNDYYGIALKEIYIWNTTSYDGFTSASLNVQLVSTAASSYNSWNNIGLPVPMSPSSSASGQVMSSQTSLYHASGRYGSQYHYGCVFWIPKSTSAQAALATLLPVQDECEAMDAEIKQAEQDWIDNPDETVAVDGNGVPIAIVNKKAELATKQAELEKLREDYFSKLGDWKNEVQD